MSVGTGMLKLQTFLVALLVASLSPNKLGAASVAVTASSECGVTVSGMLTEGDTEKVKAALEQAQTAFHNSPRNAIAANVVCLNSRGGSLREALQLVSHLMEDNHIATYIPSDAVCIEACAFVFMAGRESFENLTFPKRAMHVTAQLSFRAPPPDPDSLKSGAIAASYREAVQTLGTLANHNGNHSVGTGLDKDLPYPRSLIVAFIKAGSQSAVSVATLSDAHRWSIDLKGIKPLPAVQRSGLFRACKLHLEAQDRTSNVGSFGQPDAPIPLSSTKAQRTSFPNFGTKSRTCFADVYKDRAGRIHLAISFGASASDQSVTPLDHLPKLLAESPNTETKPPIWTVLPLETPVSDLR